MIRIAAPGCEVEVGAAFARWLQTLADVRRDRSEVFALGAAPRTARVGRGWARPVDEKHCGGLLAFLADGESLVELGPSGLLRFRASQAHRAGGPLELACGRQAGCSRSARGRGSPLDDPARGGNFATTLVYFLPAPLCRLTKMYA